MTIQGHRRVELQGLARAKLQDAELLLLHGRFSNAYYLAGYSVELGLKACIARQFSADVIPPKGYVNDVYSHDLRELAKLAGLYGDLKQRESKDSSFAANWAIVAQWSEASRYEPTPAANAQLLISAISTKGTGVLEWIQQYW